MSSLVSPTTTEAELSQAAAVLSNAISFAQNSAAGLSIVSAIKGVTDSIISLAVEGGSSLSITSTNLILKVQSIDPSSPTSASPSDDISLSIPAGIAPTIASTT